VGKYHFFGNSSLINNLLFLHELFILAGNTGVEVVALASARQVIELPLLQA
jgi:hypothetical protein